MCCTWMSGVRSSILVVRQAGFHRVGVGNRDRSERDQEEEGFHLIYPAGDHFVSFVFFFFFPPFSFVSLCL
ncbi:hypothetical protein BJY01DRAFT_171867 [Aspergillus pseudoustus]|uniref:Uncharacterized protein n=1 Tax=Aspergillus pseudoustus TaxID=1810923 RepID=A0ABR4KX81_9EURO